MKTSAKISHKVARGELCLVGQIAFLLGGPALVARLWRWR
jgi:hypothetical protein